MLKKMTIADIELSLVDKAEYVLKSTPSDRLEFEDLVAKLQAAKNENKPQLNYDELLIMNSEKILEITDSSVALLEKEQFQDDKRRHDVLR